MMTFERMRRTILQGAIFFAAIWIVTDLLAGIGTDRLVRYLFMSVLFAVFSLPMNYFLESFAKKMQRFGRPATLRGNLDEIDRIVHADKQPADPPSKG